MCGPRSAASEDGFVKDDSDEGGEGEGEGFDAGRLNEPTVEGIVKRSSSSVVEEYGPVGLVRGLSKGLESGRAVSTRKDCAPCRSSSKLPWTGDSTLSSSTLALAEPAKAGASCWICNPLAFLFVGLLPFVASPPEKRRSSRRRPVPNKAVFLKEPLRLRFFPCTSSTLANEELLGEAKSSSASGTSGKGTISSEAGEASGEPSGDGRKKGSFAKKLADGDFLWPEAACDFDRGRSVLVFGEDGVDAGLVMLWVMRVSRRPQRALQEASIAHS